MIHFGQIALTDLISQSYGDANRGEGYEDTMQVSSGTRASVVNSTGNSDLYAAAAT